MERSRLDRRRPSVAMRRYRGSREQVKERMMVGGAMVEGKHDTMSRAVGHEYAEMKKTAQKRSWWKPDGGSNTMCW
jgi:hypothetical protein